MDCTSIPATPPIHRLDKWVVFLILFALGPATVLPYHEQTNARRQFQQNPQQKYYVPSCFLVKGDIILSNRALCLFLLLFKLRNILRRQLIFPLSLGLSLGLLCVIFIVFSLEVFLGVGFGDDVIWAEHIAESWHASASSSAPVIFLLLIGLLLLFGEGHLESGFDHDLFVSVVI
jgi:hypothetical protein